MRKFCLSRSLIFFPVDQFNSPKQDFNSNGAMMGSKRNFGVSQSSRNVSFSKNWMRSVSVSVNDKEDDIAVADDDDGDVTAPETAQHRASGFMPSLTTTYSLARPGIKDIYRANSSARAMLPSEVIDVNDSDDEDRKNVLPFRVECQSCKEKLGAEWKKHECVKTVFAQKQPQSQLQNVKVEEILFVDTSAGQADAADSEAKTKMETSGEKNTNKAPPVESYSGGCVALGHAITRTIG